MEAPIIHGRIAVVDFAAVEPCSFQAGPQEREREDSEAKIVIHQRSRLSNVSRQFSLPKQSTKLDAQRGIFIRPDRIEGVRSYGEGDVFSSREISDESRLNQIVAVEHLWPEFVNRF